MSQLTTLREQNSKKVKDNEANRPAFSNDIIAKSIKDVSKLAESAINHIDLLKILHKKDTCEYIGNRLIFDKNKLSGGDGKGDITFTGDDRIATQTKVSFVKCLWLRTVDGIPTDCPNPVEWKIKISNTDNTSGTDLPKLMMGIGLDSFNPVTTHTSSKDCKPIPGFWGANGTHAFNNSVESKFSETNIFKSEDIVKFTLSPDTSLDKSKNKFELKIVIESDFFILLYVLKVKAINMK